MDFQAYLTKFGEILNNPLPGEPYSDADFLDYTKLNLSRTRRWLKTGKLKAETILSMQSIKVAQTWIVITEPWCGDAAHSVPFIEMMAKENPLITTVYELRDAHPNRIDDYLTNGSKSIPKLIIQGDSGEEIIWGPRPAECQVFFQQSVKDKTDLNEVKQAIQTWYNQDKGQAIQYEIMSLIQTEIDLVSERL